MSLNITTQQFVGNGSNTQFTLNQTVANTSSILTIVNGLVQVPETDYTISGTTLTFTIAPYSSADIEIRYYSMSAEPGYSGSMGYTGSEGPNGYQGSLGFQGSVGFKGSAGDPGGSTGFTGSAGSPGGFTGSAGSIGYTGSPGISYSGSTGFQGSAGFIGSVGFKGSAGDPGGSTGFTGSAGSPGGFTGSEGAIGYTGSPGASYSGSVGYQGSTGSVGYSGSTGASGYAGSLGFKGSVGVSGIANVYIDSTGDPAPFNGELWFDADNGYLSIYYEPEETWVGIGPGLRGAVGFSGSTGDIGPEGFTGSTGFNGSKGFTGSIGYTGSAALLVENYIDAGAASGTVTLNVSTSNVFKVTPTGSFLVNFTNISAIPNNKTTSLVLIIDQGATARLPLSVSFDGTEQTLLWQGGSLPSGNANKYDFLSFTILKLSSGTTVLAQLIGFG